jgi:hypothetical protein
MDESKLTNITIFKSLSKNRRDLSSELCNLYRRVEPILERIAIRFPEFTDHSIRHSLALLDILDWLIPEETKVLLSDYDKFCLMACCALHDIGMAINSDYENKYKSALPYLEFHKKQKIIDESISDNLVFAEYIRRNHHIFSREIISDGYKNGRKSSPVLDCNIEEVNVLNNYIGIISESHGNSILDFQKRHPFTIPIGPSGQRLNIGYLAVCLRFADYLHITRDRTPSIVFNFVNPQNSISQTEWAKHLSVEGIGPSGTSITVRATCELPKIHFALETLLENIELELSQCQRYLLESSADQSRFSISFQKIISDVKPKQIYDSLKNKWVDTYKPLKVKFSLSTKEIFDLFMGERLYRDKTVGIRELLQNSVDAIRLMNIMPYKPHGWSPKIMVRHFKNDENKEFISVSDNGVGMDESIIKEYLCKIGRSYYKRSEVTEQIKFYSDSEAKSFVPISEFGIGILSCLMMADQILIDTLRFKSSPLQVEISNIYEFFTIRDGNRQENEFGTTVTLRLNESDRIPYVSDYDEDDIKSWVHGVVGYYAVHVEFPINVIDEVQGVNRVVQPKKAISANSADVGLIVFNRKKDRGMNGFIDVSSKIHDDWRISQNGFYVPEESNHFSASWERENHLIPNWLKGRMHLDLSGVSCLPLTVARDYLLETQDQRKDYLRKFIIKKVVDHINKYYQSAFDKKRTFKSRFIFSREIHEKFFNNWWFDGDKCRMLRSEFLLFDFLPYLILQGKKRKIVTSDYLSDIESSYFLIVNISEHCDNPDYYIELAEQAKSLNKNDIIVPLMLPVSEDKSRIEDICGYDGEIAKAVFSEGYGFMDMRPSTFAKKHDFEYFHAQTLFGLSEHLAQRCLDLEKFGSDVECYQVKKIPISVPEYNKHQRYLLKYLHHKEYITFDSYCKSFPEIAPQKLRKDLDDLLGKGAIYESQSISLSDDPEVVPYSLNI